jgi:hypothetical protein
MVPLCYTAKRNISYLITNPNAAQAAFYRAAFDYYNYNEECNFQYICDTVRSWLTYFFPQAIFEDAVDFIGDWYNWHGLKYLLFEYETYLASGANVHLDWKIFQKKDKKDTIEHILPQTPDKQYWVDRWSEKEIKSVTDDLGNLVVTLDNSSYGNKGFDEKKGSPGKGKCYANSALFSERELCQFDEWTYKEFEIRRKNISDWIKDRWFIEDYNGETSIDEDDDFENNE